MFVAWVRGLTWRQCIKELRDKAGIFKETGLVNVLDADLTIVKSDVAVSEDVRWALCEGVRPLEDVPDRLKDWHPRSEGLVLDLVHPSLFPVVYGLTRYLPDEKVPLDRCLEHIGRGTTMAPFEGSRGGTSGPYEWGSFQWLPTDVKLTDEGPKLQGYVNNLHPERHRHLYGVLEDIVAATVPLWEEALSGFDDRRRIVITESGEDDWTYPEGLRYRIPRREDGPNAWYDPLADATCSEGGTIYRDAEDDNDDNFLWEFDLREWREEHRILKQREPRSYEPQAELPNAKKRVNLRERCPEGLQVIFKLANIQLTPEKPTYGGGSWHVEGGFNEMICASAIYYYDQENITDSHLAFRQAMATDEITRIPDQNEYEAIELHFGIEQNSEALQDLGHVLTREGRLLAFPNCVQHRVGSFELADKSRPGHRKILAMFLIDPARRVLSTSNVPPQRRDWWAEELRAKNLLAQLPAELREYAIGMVDFPVSWEKALEIREQLMDERSYGNEKVTEELMEVSTLFLSFSRIGSWETCQILTCAEHV